MKSLLAVLIVALSSGMVWANDLEKGRGEDGGTTMTPPDQYYNPCPAFLLAVLLTQPFSV